MTGYGSGRVAFGDGHLVLDVRCVNHRYLDVRVRLPAKIQHLVPDVERGLRSRLERGRVDASVRLEGRPLGKTSLDVARAKEALEQLDAVAKTVRPNEPVPLSLLGAVPELFVSADVTDDGAIKAALQQATQEACDAIAAMRQQEGQALKEDFAGHLARVRELETELTVALPALQKAYADRMRERVGTLLEGTGATIEPGRLAQEIALLVEKADVAEELSRLGSHRQQLLKLIEGSGGALGKRIDFLLQELGREANTLGAKTSDAEAMTTIIELKTEIERMREQAQNVL